MFKTLSAQRRGRRSEAQPGEVRQEPVTLQGRAYFMRREPTDAEDKLRQYLRAGRLDGWKFRQQVVFGEKYIADFVCHEAKLVIEVDGSQHGDNADYDEKRTKFLEQRGYRVLRYWNNDVLQRTAAVIEAIRYALRAPLPTAAQSPSPLRGGEG